MSSSNAYTAFIDGWNVGYYYGRMDELHNDDYRIKRPAALTGQLMLLVMDGSLVADVNAIDVTAG